MPQVSYAISPVSYDWERDTIEKEEIKKEIEDSRFEQYYPAWTSCNYADLHCVFTRKEKKESVTEEVASVVSLALSNLAWNEEDQNSLMVLMFNFYCSTTSNENCGEIWQLLDKYIKPACRELMKDSWQSW